MPIRCAKQNLLKGKTGKQEMLMQFLEEAILKIGLSIDIEKNQTQFLKQHRESVHALFDDKWPFYLHSHTERYRYHIRGIFTRE